MKVTVTLQNLADGAVNGDGRDRWPLLVERLGPTGTDILLLNEALDWGRVQEGTGISRLQRAAADLGLIALDLPHSRSGYHVAIAYRPETVGDPVDYNTDFADEVTHGVAVAAWDVGLSTPLGAAVGHFSPFSRLLARRDAELTGYTAQRYGPYAVLGADANYPPLGGPPADLSRMSRINIARRFNDPLADPPSIPNTEVAEALAADGFHDSFTVLHQRTGDPQFQARTGRSDRIDWIMVSESLVGAITTGYRLDHPSGASNHCGVSITLDTSLAA